MPSDIISTYETSRGDLILFGIFGASGVPRVLSGVCPQYKYKVTLPARDPCVPPDLDPGSVLGIYVNSVCFAGYSPSPSWLYVFRVLGTHR